MDRAPWEPGRAAFKVLGALGHLGAALCSVGHRESPLISTFDVEGVIMGHGQMPPQDPPQPRPLLSRGRRELSGKMEMLCCAVPSRWLVRRQRGWVFTFSCLINLSSRVAAGCLQSKGLLVLGPSLTLTLTLTLAHSGLSLASPAPGPRLLTDMNSLPFPSAVLGCSPLLHESLGWL